MSMINFLRLLVILFVRVGSIFYECVFQNHCVINFSIKIELKEKKVFFKTETQAS